MRYEHELAAREHLAMEAGIEKGIEKGHDIASIEHISNIMEMLHLSATEAMNALKIPANKQEQYLTALRS